MKYLLILLFLPSCVTIYVTEKPKLASHISDEHHCGEWIYKDAPKFNAAPAVISIMPIYEGIAEIADSATLTYPIWHTNELAGVPLVKIVDNSEIPDWLKNCDTTLKN